MERVQSLLNVWIFNLDTHKILLDWDSYQFALWIVSNSGSEYEIAPICPLAWTGGGWATQDLSRQVGSIEAFSHFLLELLTSNLDIKIVGDFYPILYGPLFGCINQE